MALVSIIIPVYNCELHLATAIESALHQTWEEKEVIVVDDGSTDASFQVAKQYEKKGVTVITQQNSGASKARNVGLEVAKGEWIQFLDADDFLRDDKIEKQLAQVNNYNQLAVCKTIHFIKDVNKGVVDDDSYFNDYLNDPVRFLIKLYGGFDYRSGMIQPNSFLVSRSLIEKAGKWNESLSLDDDGEFFCRVILNAKEIIYHPEIMNYYRKYSSNSSLSGTKSRKAYLSQFNSICFKHQHLLQHNKDEELVPYIHTATFKALHLLMHEMYPQYEDLYIQVSLFAKSLIKHHSRGDEVYGGALANFIGNRIGWKVLKRLQILKSRF